MENAELEIMQEIRIRDMPWSNSAFENIRLMVESLAPEGWTVDVQTNHSNNSFDFYAVRLPAGHAGDHNRTFNGVLPA